MLPLVSLNPQDNGGDGKGDCHNDYKHRAGFHAVGFHCLVQVDLNVLECRSVQVADKNIVAKDNADRKQRGYNHRGNNIRHDNPEIGVNSGSVESLGCLDQDRHINCPHAVSYSLVDVGKNNNAVCTGQHDQAVAQKGFICHVHRQNTDRKNDALNRVGNHTDDLHNPFQTGEKQPGHKKRQQNQQDRDQNRNDADQDGSAKGGQKSGVAENLRIGFQGKPSRNNSRPVLKEGINYGDNQRNQKPDKNQKENNAGTGAMFFSCLFHSFLESFADCAGQKNHNDHDYHHGYG